MAGFFKKIDNFEFPTFLIVLGFLIFDIIKLGKLDLSMLPSVLILVYLILTTKIFFTRTSFWNIILLMLAISSILIVVVSEKQMIVSILCITLVFINVLRFKVERDLKVKSNDLSK